MELHLKNIGLIREANVTVNGLTLIAGENDNGKSTVGKVLFCIVKAIARYKEDLDESTEYRVEEKVRETFFKLRRSVILDGNGTEILSEFSHLSSSNKTLVELLAGLDRIIDKLPNLDLSEDSMIASKAILKDSMGEISKILNSSEDPTKSIERALNKVFASEFDSSILLDEEDEGSIKLYDNQVLVIEVKVTQDNKIHLLKDVEPIEFEDVTFIESPLILNNHDLLIRSKSGLDISKRNLNRLGVPYTTLHIKDLFDKLRELPIAGLFEGESLEGLNSDLHSVINGEILYDSKEKDFVFRREGKNISIKNTASGIKVFGMLQLLSNNGFLKKNSVLVLDEPENHLHPKWQIKLAEIIVKLAKHQVFVIVSSHSPYFIEALKRYSDKEEMSKFSNFLLAKDQIIQDKDRLSEIFEILSEPFEVFRQMDLEAMKDE